MQNQTQHPGSSGAQRSTCRNGGFTPVQGFQPNQLHNLPLACPQAAQHPIKAGALQDAAVEAGRNHKDTGKQNHDRQHSGNHVKPQNVAVIAAQAHGEDVGIFSHTAVRQLILLFDFRNCFSKIGVVLELQIVFEVFRLLLSNIPEGFQIHKQRHRVIL